MLTKQINLPRPYQRSVDIMPAVAMTKNQFLHNLERALKKVVCDRMHADADAETKKHLTKDIEDFIKENVSFYSLEELTDTFLSAQAAVGLFYEYQDAKRLTAQRDENTLTGMPGISSDDGIVSDTELETLWREPVTGMEFIRIPGGRFDMGAGPWDDQALSDEQPVHEVHLDSFWMGKYPVTVAQYTPFVRACPEHSPVWFDPDHPDRPLASAPSDYRENPETICGADYPVTGISWRDGDAYAQWLQDKTGFSFQLPSEAQWEYAARSGGRAEKYAGGLPLEKIGWYAANSGGRSHRVGTKTANGLGLYDMCGNVNEWCLDLYRRDAYERHNGPNPVNLRGAGTCVVRGGSFRYGAQDLRCADRGHYVPENREHDLGFRLVRLA